MVLPSILTSLPSLAASAARDNAASLRAAGQAMAELGAAGCVGSACVKSDLVTSDSVRVLSKSVFNIFLPMLLGTNIARTVVANGGLTRSSIAVPVITVLHCSTMFVLARYLLLPLFGMDYDECGDDDSGQLSPRSTAVVCSFGNSGVIPLLFAEALFRAPYVPSDMENQCIGYISLYLVGWSPFFWSFGRSVLVGNLNSGSGGGGGSDPGDRTAAMLGKAKQLFPPPVVGVAIGMLISATPLRRLFLAKSGEPGGPLAVVYSCLRNLGRAASPVALLVLTSSLALGSRSGGGPKTIAAAEKEGGKGKTIGSSDQTTAKGGSGAAGTLQRWACVSACRFVVSPLLMTAFLRTFHKMGVLKSARDEPALWFVLLLESCMPPAQNSVLMLQVANKGAEASQMARFLFTVYVTGMIPVVLVLSVALQWLGLAG